MNQLDKKSKRQTVNANLKKKFIKPIPMSVVPSFFTLMNLFCGFVAIIQIHNGQLALGAGLIVFAGLFDALDGFVARLAHGESEFGLELDSLSDVVSFGVAPGFLLYTFAFHELSTLGIFLSSFPALCGAVRLARFNVEAVSAPSSYFRGLPIPAQAAMVVGFILTFKDRIDLFDVFTYGKFSVMVPMVILLSLLMVSTVPFDKIPRFAKGKAKEQKGKLFLFTSYMLIIIIFHAPGLMVSFSIFILKGLMRAAKLFWEDVNTDAEEDALVD